MNWAQPIINQSLLKKKKKKETQWWPLTESVSGALIPEPDSSPILLFGAFLSVPCWSHLILL